jgi:hypothetical protein
LNGIVPWLTMDSLVSTEGVLVLLRMVVSLWVGGVEDTVHVLDGWKVCLRVREARVGNT